MNLKIALYSPYLDTAGGGEKYILTIAEALSSDHQVFILLDSHLRSLGIENIKEKVNKLHNINLSKLNFINAPIGKGSFILERLVFLRQFDFLFYLTDGSIFYSTAKNNIIHFQVPFKNLGANNLWEKIKLSSWKKAICNSNFTANIIKESWPIKISVIYPPVSVDKFKPLRKKNQIISVGRFFGYLKDKKHLLLIDAFKKLIDDNNLKSWSLHLVGAASEGDEDYLNELKREAKRYAIYFHINIPFSTLQQLYGESTIYWHAAGFEEEDPKKMEHFGITTVEAMAAGCIPVVISKGGQTEIVKQGVSGFLWDDIDELKQFSLELVKNNNLRKRMAKEAVQRSKNFSKEKFQDQIIKLVNTNNGI